VLLVTEEEDSVHVCKFCGKTECNCCPKCGSKIDWDEEEVMCDSCGWAQ